MRYSNNSNVPLSVAVFLATDNYEYNSDPNTISATTLMKPIRQIVLAGRATEGETSSDLMGQLSSRLGSAIHDGIERAWIHNYAKAMEALGYPKGAIRRIKINPNPQEVTEDDIPVYLEQRTSKEVEGFTVSGKFDFVAEGRVEDFKTTSVYTYMLQRNSDKYILQGSIYRWLNPDIITADTMAIQFLFTDWSAMNARTDPNYPRARHQEQLFRLLPISVVDGYVKKKLRDLKIYRELPEAALPPCGDEDLWRKEPVFKYYRDPSKTTGRSTKNFDTREEASLYLASKGGQGIVLEKPGEVVACKYCAAYLLCSQKDLLIERGELSST